MSSGSEAPPAATDPTLASYRPGLRAGLGFGLAGLNLRFLPMGVAAAPALRGRAVRRATEGQAMVDASWALAARGDDGFDRELMLGATLPQYPAWVGGTALGVFFGDTLGDPATLGLDAIFPAFFLGLLAAELDKPRAAVVVLAGGAIALARSHPCCRPACPSCSPQRPR